MHMALQVFDTGALLVNDTLYDHIFDRSGRRTSVSRVSVSVILVSRRFLVNCYDFGLFAVLCFKCYFISNITTATTLIPIYSYL